MISMAVTSLYVVADGIFVGRCIGQGALAAVNLVMPVLMMSFALADMIAVGSSVQISIHLGEKKQMEASRIFSFCTLMIIGISFVVGLAGFFLAEPIIRLMGADADVTAQAASYLRVYAVFAPLIMIFFAVDNFLRICGRVRYSMVLNIVTSLVNIALDYLFLAVFRWPVGAAALASCIGMALGTFFGFLPFFTKRLPLRFVKGTLKLSLVGNILANGSSEFFSNIASSALMVVLNAVLLHLAGSTAVAAFSIVMYVDSIVSSLIFGLADSIQPAISFNYGAGNRRRMFLLEKGVLIVSAGVSLLAMALMYLFGGDIIPLFVKDGDPQLLTMSLRAMELFAISYLVVWVGTAISSFLTALNRPGFSLALAFSRTLVFPLICLAALPGLLGLDGVWITPAISGALTMLLALVFLFAVLKREKARLPSASGVPQGPSDTGAE